MDTVLVTVLSDLHLDINSKRRSKYFAQELIKYLHSIEAEILLITGDIGGRLSDIVNFLKLSTSLGYSYKIFVPGNHDLWVSKDSYDLSLSKYYKILPDIFNRFGWHYLPKNPIILNNVGFVGSTGWYDYSLRNPIWDSVYDLEIYSNKINPVNGLSWMDQYFVRFGDLDDEAVTQKFVSEMKEDFAFLQTQEECFDIVVLASHMVPFQQFVKYRGVFEHDYFTAFFGSREIGQFYTSLPDNIDKIAIFGQTHIPQYARITSTLEGYCVPIGYPREYGPHLHLDEMFQERIVQIEL